MLYIIYICSRFSYIYNIFIYYIYMRREKVITGENETPPDSKRIKNI